MAMNLASEASRIDAWLEAEHALNKAVVEAGVITGLQRVLDLAQVEGTVRIVAMHSPCVRCRTTTINKHGEHCTYVNRAGQACLDGLFFDGGLAFDRGEHLGSQRICEPAPKWAPMMAR